MAEQNMGSLKCPKCGSKLVVGENGTFEGHEFDHDSKEMVCVSTDAESVSNQPKEEYTSMGFTKYNGEPKTRTGFDGLQ